MLPDKMIATWFFAMPREATVSMSIVEIYELPKIFMDILLETGVQLSKFKRALVMSSDVDDFAFFETVSRNRGQNVVLFRSMEAARLWLIGK